MFATPFTAFHTLPGIAAIIAGVGVMSMLVNNRRPNIGTLVFLIMAIATSVTGFFFPFTKFLPSHGVGVICLVLFVPALLAQYVYHFAGAWRWIYAVCMGLNVYFLFFVLVTQLFLKVPAIHALAPNAPDNPEPAFAIAQGLLLVIFVWLMWKSATNFRGAARSDLNKLAGGRGLRIAGVWRAGRLDQQHVHLLPRDGAMLDALRNDEQFTGPERDGTVAHLDIERALEDQEKVVGLVVLVPDERALHLHDHHVGIVELRDRSRRPVIREACELFGKIDFTAHRRLPLREAGLP